MKVSICIANHDYGRWVGQAVDSALAQDHTPLEVIVVDDGSTDDSLEVLRQYGDRVTLLTLTRGGQRSAASAAFAASSGDIVMFLDADDLLEPGIVARVVEVFSEEPRPVFVQFRLRSIDQNGLDLGRDRPARPGLMPNGDLRDVVLRRRNWHYQLSSGCAYDAVILGELLPAPKLPGERGALDHHLNECVALFGLVRSIDDLGASYRVHDGSLSAVDRDDSLHPRRMIHLTLAAHPVVQGIARRRGLPYPDDADELLDPAYLGWRLWSLRVDPTGHPLAGDRARALAARGVRASLTHPHYPWPHRIKRATWFVVMWLAPARLVPRVLRWYRPDGPRVIGGEVVA